MWSPNRVFLTSHRMRVHVASSDFSCWDRTLNTGDFPGGGSDSRPAHREIAHDTVRLSRSSLHDSASGRAWTARPTPAAMAEPRQVSYGDDVCVPAARTRHFGRAVPRGRGSPLRGALGRTTTPGRCPTKDGQGSDHRGEEGSEDGKREDHQHHGAQAGLFAPGGPAAVVRPARQPVPHRSHRAVRPRQRPTCWTRAPSVAEYLLAAVRRPALPTRS